MVNNYICYIFVNKKLKMKTGKIASQTCHGMRFISKNIINKSKYIRDIFEYWDIYCGGKTIILYAKDDIEMEELYNSYPSEKIIDAGLTQVNPNSFTVLALYPKNYIINEFDKYQLV